MRLYTDHRVGVSSRNAGWRRRIVLPALAVAVVLLSGCAFQRPEDPIVLKGSDTPRLIGAAPGKVLAFRYLNGRWDQIPVQVDERALIDLGTVSDESPNGVKLMTYTDPNTFAGADPDPTIDSNDEVVFMGIDGGSRAAPGSNPPGVVAGSGEEIRFHDPVGDPTDTFAYLYRQTGNLDQSAGRPYVDYDFNLLSGNYKSTYRLQDGPNPEDSTVRTNFYTRHFSDRWADDGLEIIAPGASGVDILDRHKNLFAPGNCGRSEDTFDDAEGDFIVNKSGPVRAIRSYIGANSGPLTARQHIFYDRREDITTTLRVHAIPGVMDFFDYSPAASGMTYRSDVDPRGATIDGEPDAVNAGRIGWETVDGPQGGLSMVHRMKTDIPSLGWTSYYFDDKTPATSGAEKQCTGDSAAYGSSGPFVNQGIPNTDPRATPFNSLVDERTVFYELPGKSDGPKRSKQVDEPMEIQVLPHD
jgi:hypothetical protein